MKETEDIHIVQEILDGKKYRYRIIVEKYKDIIFSFMIRFTGSYQHSEELTQDVFLKAFCALTGFKKEKSFFPWLYTIALNTGRDWKRKHQREQKIQIEDTPNGLNEVDPIASQALSQETAVLRKEDWCLVEKNLLRLPVKYREALILRYKYERSIDEISQIFNVSHSASKMRIHRGLEQLKQLMDHEKKAGKSRIE